MGKLKITADGCESMIFEDNTSMVAGANTVLTGGNFALTTAGAREDIVLGLLINTCLSGKLEAALGKAACAGTLTQLYSQKLECGAFDNQLRAIQEGISSDRNAVSTLDTYLTLLEEAYIPYKDDLTDFQSQVGNYKLENLQELVKNVAEQAKNIQTEIRQLAKVLTTKDNSVSMDALNTELSDQETTLTQIITLS
jgi:hypothetical protein